MLLAKGLGKYRIALVGIIVDEFANVLLRNVANVLQPSCREFVVFVDDRRSAPGKYAPSGRFARVFVSQMKLAWRLVRESSRFDIVYLHAGGHWLILPVLVVKMLGKKLIVLHMGGDKLAEEQLNTGLSKTTKFILAVVVIALMSIAYSLADLIICQSKTIANLPLLRPYQKKLAIVKGGGYVDTQRFKIEVPLAERGGLVGYVGAFKPVKGVLNFLHAVPLVLDSIPGVRFVIAGDGPLRPTLEREGRELPPEAAVRLTILSWIDRMSLPSFYNQLKLLVLPSFSEGIPLVLQEAMACGTPVLASSVGGIPDLVTDGVTGFTMNRNDPRTVAENIGRILGLNNSKDLLNVVQQARRLIELEYSQDAVVQEYSRALAMLMSKHERSEILVKREVST